MFFVNNAAHAQSDDGIMYGGPIPPEITAKNTAAAKQTSVVAAGGFLRGGAPINLRPQAYIAHDNQGKSEQQAVSAKPKPTSVAVHNQNVLKAQARAAQKNDSPFPPGWGEYNQ